MLSWHNDYESHPGKIFRPRTVVCVKTMFSQILTYTSSILTPFSPTFTATIAHQAFGGGAGPVFLKNVNCNGLEEQLSECRRDDIGARFCGHYRDAGVICDSST